MSNRDKILDEFPLATIKEQYYELIVRVPLSSKQDLLDLLSDYNIEVKSCKQSVLSFTVAIPKYFSYESEGL